MNNQIHSFTIDYKNIENTLSSKVRIDNPFNPKTMPTPEFNHEFIAVWDTGATNSVISKDAAKSLNLLPITIREVQHGGGKESCHVYLVSMLIPNSVIFPYIEVIESNITSCAILIGMDIINQGDFAISNFQKQTVFTFRMPSVARIDFSSEIHGK